MNSRAAVVSSSGASTTTTCNGQDAAKLNWAEHEIAATFSIGSQPQLARAVERG